MGSFDEWINENGFNFRPEQYDLYKSLYEAGQQSKQSEVDGLRKNFNNTLKTIEIQQRFLDDADGANKILTSQLDELKKRIDEINKLVDLWREDYITLVKYDDGNRYCLEDCINRVVNILEGNTNDH